MRTLLHAAFAAVLLSLIPVYAAHAADAPYSYGGGSAYVSPVEETWSGFYAGVNLGYGWGDAGGFEPDGFLGGLTVGINYQVDRFLFGAEADIMGAGVSDEGATDFDLNWVGTVRGRIGYTFDRFVAYGTGGFAWTRAEIDGLGTDSHFHGGWTVGAGLEAALTGNISAKVEYLYMDFGDEFYSPPGANIDPDLHTFRIGVNYRF